jgi:ATP-dependent Clp protease adaptor protein ClpS
MERLMSAPGVLDRPEVRDSSGSGTGDWIVVVYNNEVNTWDQVVNILMRATGCDEQEAEMETWEIDTLGKSVVHHGQEEECERAAVVIAEIGIRVEVLRESIG